MKNITFSADERLIEDARETAKADGSSLNEQFRLWLKQYARKRRVARAMEVIDRISGSVVVGRKLTRDEMNER